MSGLKIDDVAFSDRVKALIQAITDWAETATKPLEEISADAARWQADFAAERARVDAALADARGFAKSTLEGISQKLTALLEAKDKALKQAQDFVSNVASSVSARSPTPNSPSNSK